MKKSSNPMRRSWLDETDGGWIAHRLELLLSPAWRDRPKTLSKLLERLEIEHLLHGGKENGNLSVSYRQFVEYGVSKKSIRPMLEIGQKLGLLEIIQHHEWVGNIRPPNTYRLTYVPAKDRRAPTDEWRHFTELEITAILGGTKAGVRAPERARVEISALG